MTSDETTHTSVKHTVSMPGDLSSVIDEQVDAGIGETRSEWIQEAAYLRLALQGLSLEAQGRRVSAESDVDVDALVTTGLGE